MVSVTAGELSPIVAGMVHCNTIGFWQSVYELRRAREWTEARTRWCEQQPDMVAHTGVCLVHRAEIMQLQGAWDAALEEARRAAERFAEAVLNDGSAARPKTKGVCVWESDSIDALRNSLDPLVGDAAENTYFEVDAGFAVGLPERATTSV